LRRRMAQGRYSAVVNLAAATDVDRCELEPEWAYRLNTFAAWNVALAAAEHGATLVHVSTTAIFGGDGAAGPFTERDVRHPPNFYAKSKLGGEQCVERIHARSFIVRTAWIMGGGASDKKFVGKVVAKLCAGEKVRAVSDELGSPTYARDLVVC